MKFVEQNNNERHTANAEDHDDGVDDGLPDGRRGVGGGVFEDHVDIHALLEGFHESRWLNQGHQETCQ